MILRSNKKEVRNPILALPGINEMLASLPPEARTALRAAMAAISSQARTNADLCWRRHKAPMAVYWKAVAVYAGHIRRAIPTSGAL